MSLSSAMKQTVLMVNLAKRITSEVPLADMHALKSVGWITRKEFDDRHLCDACMGSGGIDNTVCWHCEGTGEDPTK